MDYLIAPTLFQNKTCRLPGIGTLNVVTNVAATDFENAQIKAPLSSITFAAAQDDEDVFNEFTALSELIKKDLQEKGRVTLKGIGDFIKEQDGSIRFLPQQINPLFAPAVAAVKIHTQPIEHNLLVGDKEPTATVISAYNVEDEIIEKPKDRWWIWAIVLGVIGLAILASYFILHGFNVMGNVIKN